MRYEFRLEFDGRALPFILVEEAPDFATAQRNADRFAAEIQRARVENEARDRHV